MATVTVRNLDDEVRRLLRIRAAVNNRSMEAEIRHILTTIVAQDSATSAPHHAVGPAPTTAAHNPRPHDAALAQPPGAVPADRTDRHTAADQAWEALTQRERTVTELISQGLSNRQIAAHLFLSERTVETHVGSILHKLSLRSRVAIATGHATHASEH
jgi:DNA-binding NarL/FixJ family response regulator